MTIKTCKGHELHMTQSELKICDPCWDKRNSPVEGHNCIATWFSGTERVYVVCDCSCVEMYLKWDALRIKVYADAYPRPPLTPRYKLRRIDPREEER